MKIFSYRNEIYRKIIHLSSIWIVFAIYFLDRNRLIEVFSLFIILVLIYEVVRSRAGYIADFINKKFGKVLREDESIKGKFKLSGAIYVFISALLCTIFFTKIIAITAMITLILGDTAAALIGRKFGKIKFKYLEKSLEGSVAFFMVSIISVFFISQIIAVGNNYIFHAVFGIFIATFVEIISKKILIDDNLSVPLAVGGVMMFMI